MTSSSSQETATFSKEEYAAVVGKATLRHILLIESHFYVAPDMYAATTRHFNVELKEMRLGVDDATGNADGRYHWVITGHDEKGSELTRIEAVFLSGYADLKECARPAVEHFLTKIGQFAAFPYLRSFVASLNGFSGANIPTLPVLREQPAATAAEP